MASQKKERRNAKKTASRSTGKAASPSTSEVRTAVTKLAAVVASTLATSVSKLFPKILFLDIETFPLLIETWGIYEQNALRVLRWSTICGFSAKWLDGAHITKALPDYEGYKSGSFDDEKLVRELWAIVNEADIIVAQNGDDFDIKKINARFIKYGLPPPAPYKTVDTKKVSKRLFRFDSNKLDDICAYLGIGKKLSTGGFELWTGCMAGDPEAWRRMKKYNKHDVTLLFEVYERFLPWINDHPNLGLWKTDSCPKCGSNHLQHRGVARTTTRIYQRYQCVSCGGWSKSAKCIPRSTVTYTNG